jgi:hypothetical protein
MQTLKLDSGHTIRYYNGLDELPAERLSFLTRYGLEAALAPTNSRDIGEAIERIGQDVHAGKTADAMTELQNLYIGVMSVFNGYTPEAYELGCFIHDVDGVTITDLSPEGLGPIMKQLAVPVGQMTDILDEVKKNSDSSASYISLGLMSLD